MDKSTPPDIFKKLSTRSSVTVVASMLMFSAACTASPSTWQDAFDFQASYTGESATNVEGGERRGTAYAGQLFVGGELDLNALLDWEDTKVHIAMTNRHGKNLAEHYIGHGLVNPVNEKRQCLAGTLIAAIMVDRCHPVIAADDA